MIQQVKASTSGVGGVRETGGKTAPTTGRKTLEEVLRKYGQATNETRNLAAWLKRNAPLSGLPTHRLATCGDWLEFRRITSGDRAGETRLHQAILCECPTVCRLCSIRRAVSHLRTYVPLLEEQIRGGLTPVFATLTVRNETDLGACLQKLLKGLSCVADRVRKARSASSRNRSDFAPVAGGVFSVEIKLGTDGAWHPHAHGILLCRDRLDWKLCREEWSTILGYQAVANFKHLDTRNLSKSACETFKYVTKFGTVPNAYKIELFHAARRRRLIRSFGTLRGVEPSPEFTDPPLNWEELEWVRLLFRYHGAGKYSCV